MSNYLRDIVYFVMLIFTGQLLDSTFNSGNVFTIIAGVIVYLLGNIDEDDEDVDPDDDDFLPYSI